MDLDQKDTYIVHCVQRDLHAILENTTLANLVILDTPCEYLKNKHIILSSCHIHIHPHIYASICLYIHPFVYLSIHLSIRTSICLLIHPFVYTYIHLSTYPSICLYIHLLSTYPYISPATKSPVPIG